MPEKINPASSRSQYPQWLEGRQLVAEESIKMEARDGLAAAGQEVLGDMACP